VDGCSDSEAVPCWPACHHRLVCLVCLVCLSRLACLSSRLASPFAHRTAPHRIAAIHRAVQCIHPTIVAKHRSTAHPARELTLGLLIKTRPECVQQSSSPAVQHSSKPLPLARLPAFQRPPALRSPQHIHHRCHTPHCTCKTTAPSVLPPLSVLARARSFYTTCGLSTTTPVRASACAPAITTTTSPPPSTLPPIASAKLLSHPRARRMRRHRHLAPDLCHCNVP